MANAMSRVIWFCFVGWWLGTFWLLTALSLIFTIIGAPLGFVMLAKTGEIMFLSSPPSQIVNEVNIENNG